MRSPRLLRVSAGTIFLLGAAFGFMGCNRSHKTTIAVIPKASADIFWQSVHAGAVKGAQENNVAIVWDGPPNETDIAGEMQIMETMINRQVDAIAVAPSDRSAFKVVVNRAAAARIPVVIYDSGIDGGNYVTFVATDNYAGGQLGADRMGKVLGGKGNIIMIKTTPGGASTTAREDGFRNQLHAKFPNIQILDERYGMASIALSLAVAENMLTAHPNLDGIFCSNESGSTGAAQALKERGSKVKIVGFDSSPILIQELQSGIVDSLVIQDPFRMGETAVTQAAKAVRGEKTPKQMFLAPRLVTAADLSDPAVQAQIHPDLQKYLGSGS
ncbi:MAG TPA: substrate-binding domain-containing protein [Bryobacteraceae bacterium]|nr:substrate-binding domain-containing protein [Bryobacteraceae bacterium]